MTQTLHSKPFPLSLSPSLSFPLSHTHTHTSALFPSLTHAHTHIDTRIHIQHKAAAEEAEASHMQAELQEAAPEEAEARGPLNAKT